VTITFRNPKAESPKSDRRACVKEISPCLRVAVQGAFAIPQSLEACTSDFGLRDFLDFDLRISPVESHPKSTDVGLPRRAVTPRP